MQKMKIGVACFISLTRIILSPFIYFFLSTNNRVLLIYAIIIGGLTDLLDGFVARKLKETSDFGAKVDSFADFTYYFSFVAWFFKEYFALYPAHFYTVILPIMLIVLAYFITFIRFGKFASFHLYSMKTSAVLGYFTVVYSAFFGINLLLVDFCLLVWSVASLETFVASTRIKKFRCNVKSIFLLK